MMSAAGCLTPGCDDAVGLDRAECSIQMGFGDGKIPRNSQASIVDVGAPHKVGWGDLNNGAGGEEGFSIRKEIDDACAIANPLR